MKLHRNKKSESALPLDTKAVPCSSSTQLVLVNGRLKRKVVLTKDQQRRTVDLLRAKTVDLIRANLFPFSTPAEWQHRIDTTKARRLVIKNVKVHTKRQLRKIQASKRLPKAVREQQILLLTNRIVSLRGKAAALKLKLQYLEQERTRQIGSRFIRYAGKLIDVLVPGGGTAAGLALTGISMVAQHKILKILPDDQPTKAEEQRNAYIGNLQTTLNSVTSLAFGVLILPTVKAAASSLLEGNA